MASSIGESSSAAHKTPAQLLQEQHDAHNPTVEDVIDEDDVQHPPPPHGLTSTNGASDSQLSHKVAGKRKEASLPVLDTQSEEAFPSLGPASKSATVKAPGWGPRPGGTSSATPTPTSASEVSTPSRPAAATARGAAAAYHRDHFEIANSDIDKAKPIDKVLVDARRKFKVNVTSEDAGFSTRRRFTAEGPSEKQVREALLYISKEVSVKKTEKLPVPAQVSATIIGKGGANIRQLEGQYGVKIHIQRDPNGPPTNPGDVRTDTVEISGDAAAVGVVSAQILSLVKRNSPKIDLAVRDIAPEFYPFLRSRHAEKLQQLEQDRDIRVQIPRFDTWKQQAPPRPSSDGSPMFVPHGDEHILISGEQAAAFQTQQLLKDLAEQLQQELTVSEFTAEQVLHPYIVGERGMDPHEFLEQTGCVVILPPSHHETEDIHIIGPVDRHDDGKDLIERLMAQKQHRTVDLQKQFAKSPDRHSRALARYLQQKAIEREFRNSHNAELVFPNAANAASTWAVVTDDPQKAVAARNDLSKITQAYPSTRMNLIDVDPFYHQHLQALHAEQLRQEHGVHLVIPEADEDAVVLIYEGAEQSGPFIFPRTRPTSAEVKEFERALQVAQAQLLSSIPQGDILAHNVPVPRKFQEKVRRYARNEQKTQAPQSFPVQLDFGEPRTKSRNANNDSIFLRGPSQQDIDELARKIEQFLIEAERDETERGYVTTVDFPQKFTKNLIGKGGQNINALREKHDVEIDTRETGKVKIQGPQKKAEACKAEILKLGKQYEDEVNYVIKLDQRFHGELIGKNGENLHKLQGKVNNEVRIDFPRQIRDDQSLQDGSSEVGGPTRQAADEIRIRGPRAKADKVREELLNLHQYLVDNSHTSTVSVARDQIASLIGRGGSEMEKLRAETGAQIDVPNRGAEGDRLTLTIKGTKQQVEKARLELQKRAKAFDDVLIKTIKVDKKHHRALIGGSGANIRRIVLEAGGPEQSAEAVRFPRQGDDSSELTVKGTKDVVSKIVTAIEQFVNEKDNSVTETLDVPVDQHRVLIGQGGSTRKDLEQQFTVTLDIPRRESGRTGVKIVGQPADVAKAKEHILGLTKVPDSVVVQVPRAVHHQVSKNGLLFRELNRDGIKVDHNGQKPPPKPQNNSGADARATNGALPTIIDAQNNDPTFSFNIVQTGGQSSGEAGEIPWVLLGNKDITAAAIAKAKQNIELAIDRAQKPSFIGYMILPDPRLHRHVIGRGGATINKIRKSTGCDIQVPKNQGDQEAITIVGDEAGIKEARDLIWDEIEKASTD